MFATKSSEVCADVSDALFLVRLQAGSHVVMCEHSAEWIVCFLQAASTHKKFGISLLVISDAYDTPKPHLLTSKSYEEISKRQTVHIAD